MQGEGWVSAAPMTAAASFPPQAACPSPCTTLEALLAPGAAAGHTGGREGASAACRVQAICTVLEVHPCSPPLSGVHQPCLGSQLGLRGFSFKLSSCFCSQPCTDLLDVPGLCKGAPGGSGAMGPCRAGICGHSRGAGVYVGMCSCLCACMCVHVHAYVGMCRMGVRMWVCGYVHLLACTRVHKHPCVCVHV